jgi:tetratricopeptide (TPR) repeat protein
VRLWVADFGLAHCQSQAGPTLTGDLVGTLRYMSPEQALAKRVVVDQRTDVYSLGVTLYELLTLEPAFAGSDRQELLRQIAFEEPPPPRRLNKAIPVELETIVLKAIEKNPAERYGTAQELADDLERWLKDEPIRAKRPSVVQRLRRWSRRHKPVVAGLAAGLLTLLVVGVVLAFGYQRRLAETDRAVTAALAQAQTLLAEGDKQIGYPERWQAAARLALGALEKAEEVLRTGAGTKELASRVRQVRDAVDVSVKESGLLVELDRIRLEQAAVKGGHFDLARTAPLYAKALGDYGIDLAAPEEAAARLRGSRLQEALLSALADWEGITQDEAERQRVAKVYQLAVLADSLRPQLLAAVRARDRAELEKLAKKPAFQDLPASTLVILANELTAGKEWAAAERLLRAGLERKPGDFWLNHNLGMLLKKQQPPRTEEAMRYLTVALALRSDSPGVHLNVGNALLDMGDLEGAILRYRTALQIDPNYATAHSNLGHTLAKQGKVDEARAAFDQAIACYRQDIALDEKNLRALDLLGTLLCDEKLEYDGAIACFRAVIHLDPKVARSHFNLGIALSGKGWLDEAIAEYREALGLEKDLLKAHDALGTALRGKDRLDEAIDEHRKEITLDPKSLKAHYNLGNALLAKGRLEEAIAEYRQAIHLNKDAYEAHCALGNALRTKGDLQGAIRKYHEAIAIKRDYAEAYCCLGALLCNDTEDYDGAIAAFKEAIHLQPGDPLNHTNLGHALAANGQLDEAIAACREAIRLNTDYAEAHNNLGGALWDKGQLDEAIDEYRKATRLKKDFAMAHYNLGNALLAKGRLEEAIAEYRQAIDLKKDWAEAHCNLGQALLEQGQFPQAVEELRLGHDLGSRNPQWHYPSPQWLSQAERLAALDARLLQILKREAQPADAAERAQLGRLCQQPYKQLNAVAARFYAEAFAAEPKLANDLGTGHRYNAACAAALAGCGQGKGADKLDDAERARLRRQALDCLRADLAAWRTQLEDNEAKLRPVVQPTLQHWLGDSDFAGVRDPEALAKLPEAERQDWQKLWADVQELFAKAGGKSSRPEK